MKKTQILPLQDSGGTSLQDAPQQVASLHWTYRWFCKSFEYQVPDAPPKRLQVIANVHEPYLEHPIELKALPAAPSFSGFSNVQIMLKESSDK